MKQLNHSPEAAAAVLGVSLKVAHERIAWMRKQGARRIPNAFPPRHRQSDPVRLVLGKPAADRI
jgi:hypothetical protein